MTRYLDWGSLVWGLLLGYALAFWSGCGASALDRTERVYGVLHAAQAEAVGRFEERIRVRVREDCPSGEDTCALAVAEESHAAEGGLDLSADALDAAGRELIAWAIAGDDDSPSTCARIQAAVEALRHAFDLATAFGVDLASLGLPSWTCEGAE